MQSQGNGMKREMREKTQSAIGLCRIRLENLKPRLDESEQTNIVYNRFMIEKAVLEHNLKKKNFNIFSKFKSLFKKQEEKRICDYFKKRA